MSEPPPAPQVVEKPPRLPLVLSAFVCPGAGQIAQGRYLTGAFFMILFCILFMWFLISIIVPIFHNMRVSIDMAATNSQEPLMNMTFKSIGVPFLFTFGTYLVCLIDTLLAYVRDLRKWRNERVRSIVSST